MRFQTLVIVVSHCIFLWAVFNGFTSNQKQNEVFGSVNKKVLPSIVWLAYFNIFNPKLGGGVVLCSGCLLGMTWLLHPGILSNCGYLLTSQTSSTNWRRAHNPTPSEGFIIPPHLRGYCSWWQIRWEQSVFFEGVATSRVFILQYLVHMGSTNLDVVEYLFKD